MGNRKEEEQLTHVRTRGGRRCVIEDFNGCIVSESQLRPVILKTNRHIQENFKTLDMCGRGFAVITSVLSHHSRLWRSGVYPPQQSASWYHRNRLLDFRHVVCVVVLCPVILLLETIIFKRIVKRARRQLR